MVDGLAFIVALSCVASTFVLIQTMTMEDRFGRECSDLSDHCCRLRALKRVRRLSQLDLTGADVRSSESVTLVMVASQYNKKDP